MSLISCPACGLYVLRADATCPHCATRLSTSSARGRVLTAGLGAGLSMFACSSDPGPGETAAEGMSTTAMTTTTDTNSTTMDPTETSAGTDSMTETETETTSAPEPPYGVPDQPCEDFGPSPVIVGANAVELFAGAGQLVGSCGGSGSGNIYAFTAELGGDYEFAVIDADFDSPVVSLFGYSCWDFDVLECGMPPEAVLTTVGEGETVHIIVDSTEQTDGSATLTITPQ